MSLFDKEYISNNKFIFSCTGLLFSFSKISGISQSIETETINEGGYNDSPRFLLKPKTKLETITLEHGIRTRGTLGLTLRIGMPVYIGTIIIMDGLIPGKIYAFEEGIVTKYEVGELDALNKTVLVRKLEISHSGLYEV